MNQLLPPEQGSMVRGKAYLSDVQKREKRRSKTRVSSFLDHLLLLNQFSTPSVGDSKKGALAARSRGKRTFIVQSLH